MSNVIRILKNIPKTQRLPSVSVTNKQLSTKTIAVGIIQRENIFKEIWLLRNDTNFVCYDTRSIHVVVGGTYFSKKE